MYLDPLVATTLIVAVIGAMPVGRALGDAIDRSAPAQRGLATIALFGEWSWLALVLIASCAALAAGTYNPFIYFRF
jgi:hypothetical protein